VKRGGAIARGLSAYSPAGAVWFDILCRAAAVIRYRVTWTTENLDQKSGDQARKTVKEEERAWRGICGLGGDRALKSGV